MTATLRYKFVEVTPVSDADLEQAVNPLVAEGWQLDTIHFVMREASHRPALAFVSFVRRIEEDDSDGDGQAAPPAG